MTRTLVSVTNTTVVSTVCELLRQIAAQGLTRPNTLVIDNAHSQRNALVVALAGRWGIPLLFLSFYSPNLKLIERLWKFTKHRGLYGRYHPSSADFRATIELTLSAPPSTPPNLPS